MPFIGNTPQTQSFAPAVDYFSGNGVTVTFTLSRPVVSVAQLTVAVDNVIQNPSSAFTVSGNSITFTSAPLSGTNNIWVEYTSLITTYAAISQDPSVIGDITATGGFLAEGDFGNSYIDGTIVDYVTGNARITTGPIDDMTFYHGGTSGRSEMMKLSYAGNSTLTGNLAISGQASLGTGQTDYVAALGGGGTARVEAIGGNTNINLALSTKGTGAVYFWKAGYGGTNTMLIDGSGYVTKPLQPGFSAVRTSAFSSVGSVVIFQTTEFNTGSHYNTSNGRFTAPIAGKYIFDFSCHALTNGSELEIRKNGSAMGDLASGLSDAGAIWISASQTVIIDMAASDYAEVFLRTGSVQGDPTYKVTKFCGYLLG